MLIFVAVRVCNMYILVYISRRYGEKIVNDLPSNNLPRVSNISYELLIDQVHEPIVFIIEYRFNKCQ